MSPPPSSAFGKLIQWDRDLSFLIYRQYNSNFPRVLLLLLELSGHGVPWLIAPIVIFVFKPELSATAAALMLNFLALTIVDLVAIGIFKPIFHRARPAYNTGIGQITIHVVDQFSFPSGHATRAGFVAAFLADVRIAHPEGLDPLIASSPFLIMTIIWAVAICASRVALGRHHVLDVLVGVVLGILYVMLWQPFWIGPSFSAQMRNSLRHSLLGSAKFVTATAGSPFQSSL